GAAGWEGGAGPLRGGAAQAAHQAAGVGAGMAGPVAAQREPGPLEQGLDVPGVLPQGPVAPGQRAAPLAAGREAHDVDGAFIADGQVPAVRREGRLTYGSVRRGHRAETPPR